MYIFAKSQEQEIIVAVYSLEVVCVTVFKSCENEVYYQCVGDTHISELLVNFNSSKRFSRAEYLELLLFPLILTAPLAKQKRR